MIEGHSQRSLYRCNRNRSSLDKPINAGEFCKYCFNVVAVCIHLNNTLSMEKIQLIIAEFAKCFAV